MKKINFYLFLSALLLIVLGLVCIFNPVEIFQSMAWLVGLMILLTGISGLLFGLKEQKELPNAGSSVMLAIFQILVGILFVCNGLLAASTMVVVFALWVMFEGISLSVLSFDYKRSGYQQWWLMLLLGILSLLLGFFALRNPGGVGAAFGILLGLGILSNGIERVVACFALKRIRNRIRDFKESLTATNIDDKQQ